MVNNSEASGGKESSSAHLNERLLFASGIIASFFALLSNYDLIISHFTKSLIVLPYVLMGTSAAFSFGFILLYAASIKYGVNNRIMTLKVEKSKYEILYDVSVDVFVWIPLTIGFALVTKLANTHLWHGSFAEVFIYAVTIVVMPTLLKYIWEMLFKILWLLHNVIISETW